MPKHKFFALLGFLLLKNLKYLQQAKPLNYKRPILLIAHPDDECMFFAPTLLGLRPLVFCLSSGNYYNLGKRRSVELRSLCEHIKVPVIISNFMDGGEWDPRIIKKKLIMLYGVYKFDAIVTFDKHGVSGHKNHISCFNGASLFIESCNMPVNCLKSKNMFCKYVIDYEKAEFGYKSDNILKSIKLMLFHRSQLTWFRSLYILFSNYMIYNDYLTY